MAVFRVERNTGYTVMSNHHLRNKELSLKAKGLLSQMLSLPEDWDYTLAGLSHINREKIDAIREAVKELEKAGYIVRSRERDEKGRLRGADYVIYEQPQPREPEAATSGGQPPILDLPTLENPTLDNPTLEKPTQEKPTLENPTQLNKDILSKEQSITDLSSTDSIPFHSLNPLPFAHGEAATPPERKRTEAKSNSAVEIYREIIKDNIEYDHLIQNCKIDKDRLDEIVDLMLETVCTARKTIFNMIRSLSENVIVPIAGVIITFVMCYELIQLVIEKNNLHDLDTWIFFKWIFKTFVAVLLVTNTWNIVMGVFDITQSVVNDSAGVIISDTSIDIATVITDIEAKLDAMSVGGLLGLWFQSLFVGLTMKALSICIMLVVYGRMIEIYLVTSIAPIPVATMVNREWGGMGQNYLKSLLALGFQAFLILVCVGIYAVLIQTIAATDDISGAIWSCMGYTVLLCFTLFKTGSLAKSVFSAH